MLRKSNALTVAAMLICILHSDRNSIAQLDDSSPLFEQSTLVLGDDVHEPVANGEYEGPSYRTGKYRVSIKDGTVSIRDIETNAVSTLRHDPDVKWSLSAAHNAIAYFVSSGKGSALKKPRIRRLDLGASAWLDNLKLETEIAENEFAQVLKTYIDDEYIVVVTALSEKEDDSFFDKTIRSFSVACFGAGKTEAKWSRSIEANKGRAGPGVYLWSSSNPDYADAEVQVVSRFEDRVVICPEGKQPIRCLNIDSGTELWRCDRIWEFQRGFIGPSVWQHYIGRFRIDGDFGFADDEEVEIAKAAKAFNENFECSIIGGPAIVELKNGSDWSGGHRIFVAVSQQPKVSLGGYTALMAAASEGSPKVTKLLVEAGANVDAVDNRKRTALMFAADGYDEGETINVLLESGANPNLTDSKGGAALDRCKNSQNMGAEKRMQILKAAMKASK